MSESPTPTSTVPLATESTLTSASHSSPEMPQPARSPDEPVTGGPLPGGNGSPTGCGPGSRNGSMDKTDRLNNISNINHSINDSINELDGGNEDDLYNNSHGALHTPPDLERADPETPANGGNPARRLDVTPLSPNPSGELMQKEGQHLERDQRRGSGGEHSRGGEHSPHRGGGSRGGSSEGGGDHYRDHDGRDHYRDGYSPRGDYPRGEGEDHGDYPHEYGPEYGPYREGEEGEHADHNMLEGEEEPMGLGEGYAGERVEGEESDDDDEEEDGTEGCGSAAGRHGVPDDGMHFAIDQDLDPERLVAYIQNTPNRWNPFVAGNVLFGNDVLTEDEEFQRLVKEQVKVEQAKGVFGVEENEENYKERVKRWARIGKNSGQSHESQDPELLTGPWSRCDAATTANMLSDSHHPLARRFLNFWTLARGKNGQKNLGFGFMCFRSRPLLDRYNELISGKKIIPWSAKRVKIAFAKQKTITEVSEHHLQFNTTENLFFFNKSIEDLAVQARQCLGIWRCTLRPQLAMASGTSALRYGSGRTPPWLMGNRAGFYDHRDGFRHKMGVKYSIRANVPGGRYSDCDRNRDWRSGGLFGPHGGPHNGRPMGAHWDRRDGHGGGHWDRRGHDGGGHHDRDYHMRRGEGHHYLRGGPRDGNFGDKFTDKYDRNRGNFSDNPYRAFGGAGVHRDGHRHHDRDGHRDGPHYRDGRDGYRDSHGREGRFPGTWGVGRRGRDDRDGHRHRSDSRDGHRDRRGGDHWDNRRDGDRRDGDLRDRRDGDLRDRRDGDRDRRDPDRDRRDGHRDSRDKDGGDLSEIKDALRSIEKHLESANKSGEQNNGATTVAAQAVAMVTGMLGKKLGDRSDRGADRSDRGDDRGGERDRVGDRDVGMRSGGDMRPGDRGDFHRSPREVDERRRWEDEHRRWEGGDRRDGHPGVYGPQGNMSQGNMPRGGMHDRRGGPPRDWDNNRRDGPRDGPGGRVHDGSYNNRGGPPRRDSYDHKYSGEKGSNPSYHPTPVNSIKSSNDAPPPTKGGNHGISPNSLNNSQQNFQTGVNGGPPGSTMNSSMNPSSNKSGNNCGNNGVVNNGTKGGGNASLEEVRRELHNMSPEQTNVLLTEALKYFLQGDNQRGSELLGLDSSVSLSSALQGKGALLGGGASGGGSSVGVNGGVSGSGGNGGVSGTGSGGGVSGAPGVSGGGKGFSSGNGAGGMGGGGGNGWSSGGDQTGNQQKGPYGTDGGAMGGSNGANGGGASAAGMSSMNGGGFGTNGGNNSGDYLETGGKNGWGNKNAQMQMPSAGGKAGNYGQQGSSQGGGQGGPSQGGGQGGWGGQGGGQGSSWGGQGGQGGYGSSGGGYGMDNSTNWGGKQGWDGPGMNGSNSYPRQQLINGGAGYSSTRTNNFMGMPSAGAGTGPGPGGPSAGGPGPSGPGGSLGAGAGPSATGPSGGIGGPSPTGAAGGGVSSSIPGSGCAASAGSGSSVLASPQQLPSHLPPPPAPRLSANASIYTPGVYNSGYGGGAGLGLTPNMSTMAALPSPPVGGDFGLMTGTGAVSGFGLISSGGLNAWGGPVDNSSAGAGGMSGGLGA